MRMPVSSVINSTARELWDAHEEVGEFGFVTRLAEPWAVVRAVCPMGRVYEYDHFFGSGPYAEAAARKLAARVRKAGSINPDHWRHVRTVYGSDAYVADRCEEELVEMGF